MSAPTLPRRQRRPVGYWLGAIGRPLVALIRGVTAPIGIAAAVLVQAARPLTWRPAVRHETMRHLAEFCLGNMTRVMMLGGIVGVGLVAQAIYWLQYAGQIDLVGSVVVVLLVREIGPLLVGVVMVGCAGSVIAMDVARQSESGQLRAMDAMGIDPFVYVVLPRAVALAVTSFTLTIFFIVGAMATGIATGLATGQAVRSLGEMLTLIPDAMAAPDYLLLPLKTMTIGLFVAIVSAESALGRRREAGNLALLPRTFVRGMVAVLLIMGVSNVLA
jgi:phospholipid/cholesterol/gamma-HCH transport system permease protein